MSYERLRDMLRSDVQIRRIGSWGIETPTSPAPQRPPVGDFSLDRFNQYLSLLSEVGSEGASRGNLDDSMEICVLVWGAGWAGDARHLSICWREKELVDEGGRLDESKSRIKAINMRQYTYKAIDENWYIVRDF
jgi:hypothetical protein